MWKTRFFPETARKSFPCPNVEKSYHFAQAKFYGKYSTASLCTTLWIMWKTLLSLGVDVDGDLLDRLVENGVGFHLLFDLLERVEHGRMIALAEFAADIGR